MRMQKHWVLNQFQIVMGYIQIGKAELALEYLRRASDTLQHTTALSKMQDQEFAVKVALIWWDACEGGIILTPQVSEDMTIAGKEAFFEDFAGFMGDFKGRYLAYLQDKNVIWHMESQGNSLISSIRSEDESPMPNFYENDLAFQGKIKVEGSQLIYTWVK